MSQLKVTLKVVDEKNETAEVLIRLYTRTPAGAVKMLFGDKSAKETGFLSKTVTLPALTYLPQLILKAYVGRKWIDLPDQPVKYTESLADYGTIKISTKTERPTPTPIPFHLKDEDILKSSLYLLKEREADSLKGEKTALSSKNTTLTEEVSRLQITLSSLRKNLDDNDREVSVLAREKAELNTDNEKLRVSINGYKGEISRAKEESKSLRDQLESNKKLVDDLRTQLADKSPEETDISRVFENAGTQIGLAEEALRKQNSRFRLKNVNLELKVLPGQAGDKVKLADAKFLKEAKDLSALSTLKLEFQSERSAPTPAAGTKIKTPDLEGYTQTQVIRVLDKLGLKYHWRFESLRNTRNQLQKHGRVISQFPKAQEEVSDKSTIFVTIGQKG